MVGWIDTFVDEANQSGSSTASILSIVSPLLLSTLDAENILFKSTLLPELCHCHLKHIYTRQWLSIHVAACFNVKKKPVTNWNERFVETNLLLMIEKTSLSTQMALLNRKLLNVQQKSDLTNPVWTWRKPVAAMLPGWCAAYETKKFHFEKRDTFHLMCLRTGCVVCRLKRPLRHIWFVTLSYIN